ncbi:carboxymuconolactone decarboxylase family protein [Desulfosoma sp.]|uniref:carboxymuconolactone decarboxylase family protein n=1 Tax=Desulfosoma sp. TaxID=2603217 RepID=UPI0040495850
MLKPGALDRKTREIIAMVVSMMNNCQYCHLAHKTMALMSGASEDELHEVLKVVELFQSFTSIANALQVPCDITPAMAKKNEPQREMVHDHCGLRSACPRVAGRSGLLATRSGDIGPGSLAHGYESPGEGA